MAAIESAPLDRVAERKRAVLLARHYREAEGLTIAQIAQRLGRAPATVKGYFYDPTGEKAKAVKRRYQGVCRGCGAPTQPRNGKNDRLRVLQGLSPRSDRNPMDSRASARRDARLATPLRPPALLIRLVANPRPPPRRVKRSNDSTAATGHPPASSATCSAPGKPRARPPAPTR